MLNGTKVELTIEVEAFPYDETWQAIIKTGSTILWRGKHQKSGTEAFKIAAKLIAKLPVDFWWAAQSNGPMVRYIANLDRRLDNS